MVAALLAAALSASIVLPLPVSVKNVADAPLEGYVVFFLVEKELLLNEGIDPASMCAFGPGGEYLPLWVVPETLATEVVAVYVKIPYLAPGDQLTITLTSGPCTHNPSNVFYLFDDFKTLDTRYWTPFATPQVHSVTIRGGAVGGKGLYISGTYMAPQQYIQVVSQPLTPPLAVEALVTPMTAYDHDVCLDVREYGTESAHPAEARGAYIHAWGWGVAGEAEGRMGRFTWYRLAGPPGSASYYWDVTTWDEGGASPIFNANETFLLRIGVSREVVRYEVWQLKDGGLLKLLGHTSNLGIANETVIALGQECGGAYNFTQKGVFHWILVRPFAWPEPKIAVGAERVEESPLEPLLEFLSKPTNLILISWGAAAMVLALAILLKLRRRS